jgi:hypothetical protein
MRNCGISGGCKRQPNSAALARELLEEVGVEAAIVAFNRHVEAIAHEGDRVRTHLVIASFVARWISGEARPSDKGDAVDWINPAAFAPSPTTPGLGEILATRRGSQVSPLSSKCTVGTRARCRKRAESAPTRVASGRTGVRAKAVIPGSGKYA